MEEKDTLKEVFKTIDTIHEKVNLEDSILKEVIAQEEIKKQIAKNRKYGFIGVVVTFILTIVLFWFLNSPDLEVIFKNPMLLLSICAFILILFFIQFEIALNHSKHPKINNS